MKIQQTLPITVLFKVEHSPATPQHLTKIADNYFSTGKEVRDMEI